MSDEGASILADNLESLELRVGAVLGKFEDCAPLSGLKSTVITMARSELELVESGLKLIRGQIKGGVGELSIMTSQLGQERWILEETGQRRGGTFVEVGAGDGVFLSNTIVLERMFGWSGICIEPNPLHASRCREVRRCLVLQDCIGPRTGEIVTFILSDEYGSSLGFHNVDIHAEKRVAYLNAGRVARLTTTSLDDVLDRNNCPRLIDYMSIDTEGSEYEILSTFPLDKWNVLNISVEHNGTINREKVCKLLLSYGFTRVREDISGFDDWYTR